MSVLDKPSNVIANPRNYFTDAFLSRMDAAVELAEDYIDTVVTAQSNLRRMNDRQDNVMTALFTGQSDHYIDGVVLYKEGSYRNSALNFSEFAHDIYRDFVRMIVASINLEYGSTTFSVKNDDAYISKFTKDGISLDGILQEFVDYMDGRTVTGVRRDEAIENFNNIIAHYNRSGNDYKTLEEATSITVTGTTVTIEDFIRTDMWDRGLSHSAKMNLATLARYFRFGLSDSIVFMDASMTIDFDLPYTPEQGLKSSVKTVRIFKNGKAKITFHDFDGVQKFVEPLLKVNKVGRIK